MTPTTASTQRAEIEFLMPPIQASSYLHSELSQPHCRERDVTRPGGREVENKAEPKPSCHSPTGVLTIIGCHHFLIRPVSKKCGNKTRALQKRCPPPLLYTHTHCCTHTSHQDMQTHQTCQKVRRTDPKNKTGLVTQYTVKWLRSLPVAAGISQIKPKKKKKKKGKRTEADS